MSQPKWELIGQLGDKDPISYGGYFIFRDTTGVYAEEAEYLIVPDDDDEEDDEEEEVVEEGEGKYIVYRFILERCTFINGILSDNKFHPEHPAWFAKPEKERASRPQDTTYLKNIADCMDFKPGELQKLFCSPNPLERAQAYRAVGEYHGFENLDGYPLHLTRAEVKKRYKDELASPTSRWQGPRR
jgi:hypothetical protein